MKLLDRVRDVGLRRHLSPRTIECYQRWAHSFLLYCADRPRAVAEGAAAAADDPFDIPLLDDEPAPPAARPGRIRKGDKYTSSGQRNGVVADQPAVVRWRQMKRHDRRQP